MLYFENVNEIGKLYIEKVLFEYDKMPIVFVCRDNEKNRYLCLCTDCIVEYSWMVVKIDINILLSLIKDEITILQAFEKANEVIYIINRKCEKYEYAKYNFVDIPKEELPDENEKLENPYLIEYVRQLQIEEQTKNVDIPLVFVYESDFDIIDVDLRPRIYVSMKSSAQNSKVNFLEDMIDSMIFSNLAESSSTSLVKINNMIRNQQYFGQNNEYEFYFGEEQFLKTQGREHVWKLCASC